MEAAQILGWGLERVGFRARSRPSVRPPTFSSFLSSVAGCPPSGQTEGSIPESRRRRKEQQQQQRPLPPFSLPLPPPRRMKVAASAGSAERKRLSSSRRRGASGVSGAAPSPVRHGEPGGGREGGGREKKQVSEPERGGLRTPRAWARSPAGAVGGVRPGSRVSRRSRERVLPYWLRGWCGECITEISDSLGSGRPGALSCSGSLSRLCPLPGSARPARALSFAPSLNRSHTNKMAAVVSSLSRFLRGKRAAAAGNEPREKGAWPKKERRGRTQSAHTMERGDRAGRGRGLGAGAGVVTRLTQPLDSRSSSSPFRKLSRLRLLKAKAKLASTLGFILCRPKYAARLLLGSSLL